MKKRADGRYCKQILVGYKPDGKRIMKSIYGRTIKEVEKQERELRNKIDSGLVIGTKQNITLAEWADLWLNTYKNNVSYNTKSMYANAIQVHISPTLGNIPVSKIKPVQIQGLINALVEKGSIRTAEVVKLTLEQLFRQAVTEGYINKNVTDGQTKELVTYVRYKLKNAANERTTRPMYFYVKLTWKPKQVNVHPSTAFGNSNKTKLDPCLVDLHLNAEEFIIGNDIFPYKIIPKNISKHIVSFLRARFNPKLYYTKNC